MATWPLVSLFALTFILTWRSDKVPPTKHLGLSVSFPSGHCSLECSVWGRVSGLEVCLLLGIFWSVGAEYFPAWFPVLRHLAFAGG